MRGSPGDRAPAVVPEAMRFVLHHPKDRRLRCEYGRNENGTLFVELWHRSADEPVVSLPDQGEGFTWQDWDAKRPPFWAAVELLTGPWLCFVTVGEVAEALDIVDATAPVPADDIPEHLKRVVDLVRNLRAACGVGR